MVANNGLSDQIPERAPYPKLDFFLKKKFKSGQIDTKDPQSDL